MKTVNIMLAMVFAMEIMAEDPIALETVSYAGLPERKSVTVNINNLRKLTENEISPFVVAEAWSNGKTPYAGPIYEAGTVNGENCHLWTPYVDSATDTVYDMFSALVLKTGCTFWLCHKGAGAAVFNDLRVDGVGQIYGAKGNVTIDGKISIPDGQELRICAYNGSVFNVASDLSGNGLVHVLPQAGTSAYRGRYCLKGQNGDFFGKIKVSGRGTSNLTKNFSTLLVADSTVLGGKLDQFAYDALLLEEMSQFSANGKDLVLSKESNRGIAIGSNGGRIEVSENYVSLTVDWPVTMSTSHLYKEGAGLLVLGSPLRFLDSGASVEHPPASGHCIDVREGSLSVTDCNALNGARLAFSNGTEIVMSVLPPEGDLERYGVRCDKVSAPLATDMPIRLKVPDGGVLTKSNYAVSLLTVKSEDAEEAKDKLKVSFCFSGYRLAGISAVPDEASGMVTFRAYIYHNGFVFTVR